MTTCDSMARRFTVLLWTLLMLCVPGLARPNFSGKWTLDRDRSDLGAIASQGQVIRLIDHDDPRLIVAVEAIGPEGRKTGEMRLITHGDEGVFRIGDAAVTGSALWFGDHLMLKTVRLHEGVEVRIDELWTLSSDGRTLRVDAIVTTPNGREEVTAVFEE